jgi:hypothetical protein
VAAARQSQSRKNVHPAAAGKNRKSKNQKSKNQKNKKRNWKRPCASAEGREAYVELHR